MCSWRGLSADQDDQADSEDDTCAEGGQTPLRNTGLLAKSKSELVQTMVGFEA